MTPYSVSLYRGNQGLQQVLPCGLENHLGCPGGTWVVRFCPVERPELGLIPRRGPASQALMPGSSNALLCRVPPPPVLRVVS